MHVIYDNIHQRVSYLVVIVGISIGTRIPEPLHQKAESYSNDPVDTAVSKFDFQS